MKDLLSLQRSYKQKRKKALEIPTTHTARDTLEERQATGRPAEVGMPRHVAQGMCVWSAEHRRKQVSEVAARHMWPLNTCRVTSMAEKPSV